MLIDREIGEFDREVGFQSRGWMVFKQLQGRATHPSHGWCETVDDGGASIVGTKGTERCSMKLRSDAKGLPKVRLGALGSLFGVDSLFGVKLFGAEGSWAKQFHLLEMD